METIVHSPYPDGTHIQYPEVSPGVTRWAWSDAPQEKPVLVTAHGLRRLLRLAASVYALVRDEQVRRAGKDPEEFFGKSYSDAKLRELSNESSAVFCEGDLVMSRLFVDEQGRAVAHPDEEVDEAGIPPWEKPKPPEKEPPNAPA